MRSKLFRDVYDGSGIQKRSMIEWIQTLASSYITIDLNLTISCILFYAAYATNSAKNCQFN